MKKCVRLAVCFTGLLFTCCACSGGTPVENMATIEKQYPDSEIRRMPKNTYTYLVKKNDGSIWYLETLNISNTDISFKERIF